MVSLRFFMVYTLSAYNVILKRLGLNMLRTIVSTYHLLIKFSTRAKIEEIKSWLGNVI